MGSALSVISGVVDRVMDKYVADLCVPVGQDRDGHTIYGCDSGIFARVASNYMNFEYHVGLEWIPSGCKRQFGAWMFYSAKLPQVEKLLREAGLNISELMMEAV